MSEEYSSANFFKDNQFANPAQLVHWISQQKGQVQLKGDHKLVVMRDLRKTDERAGHVRILLSALAEMAEAEAA